MANPGVIATFDTDAEQNFVRRLWDVDLNILGHDTCTCPYEFYKRCVVNQALIDNITNTPRGLALRDVIFYRDFANDGIPLANDIWIYDKSNEHVSIFDEFTNGRHVLILLYGLKNLQPDQLYISHIYLQVAHIKIVDIQGVETLRLKENFATYVFPNAILYRRNDPPQLSVHTTHDAAGHSDRIKVLGIIAEPLGAHVVG